MPKAGRNDPCPCGSGKKFKKCCENVSNQKKISAQILPSENSSLATKETSRISRSFFQNVVQPKLSKEEEGG